MQHLLYERMEQGSTGDDAALVRLAAELKLERGQFTACLTSRKALERVLRDLYDGQHWCQKQSHVLSAVWRDGARAGGRA